MSKQSIPKTGKSYQNSNLTVNNKFVCLCVFETAFRWHVLLKRVSRNNQRLFNYYYVSQGLKKARQNDTKSSLGLSVGMRLTDRLLLSN